MKTWPTTNERREELEIQGFVEAYRRLPHGLELKIETHRDKPDYFVWSEIRKERFGVELTSVYKDDESVDECHKTQPLSYPVPIVCDPDVVALYIDRLVQAVSAKIAQARSGYNLTYPLLLSIYVNEYESIFIQRDDLEKMVRENPHVFDQLAPFHEIIFWNLPDDDVFSVK